MCQTAYLRKIKQCIKEVSSQYKMKSLSVSSFMGNNFYNNTANTGGIAYIERSQVTFTDCNMTKNNALSNAGVLINKEGNITLNNCLIKSNRASEHGGALQLSGHSLTQIENVVFSNNTCAVDGGAIKVNRKASLYIVNSSFIANKALGI